MGRLSESSKMVQLAAAVAVLVLLTVGLYFVAYKQIDDQNRLDRQKLQVRRAEVQALRKYENELPRLNQQLATLKDQLEIQKRIVPDEKEADQFMHLLQNTAQEAGIEIRRWTAKDPVTREYYTEVPFDLELDGPYYSLLNFFDRVAKLERIINVSNLQLAALQTPNSKFRHSYKYAPHESVAGTCTATTFFTRDPMMVPAGGKPAKPAAK